MFVLRFSPLWRKNFFALVFLVEKRKKRDSSCIHSEYTYPDTTMVKRLKYLWHAYNLALQKYALAQVVTAGSLYAAGDALCQFVMIKREKSKKHSPEMIQEEEEEEDKKRRNIESHEQTKYDIWRTIRFGVYGLCISGPYVSPCFVVPFVPFPIDVIPMCV